MRKYQTFIGFRYLRARLLNLLSMAVVAGCVFTFVLVLCVMWGLDRDFRIRFRGELSTISIDAPGSEIEDWEEVGEEIETVPGVKVYAPYVYAICWLRTSLYSKPIEVKGVDLPSYKNVGLVEKFFHDGGKQSLDFLLDGKEPPNPGIVLGKTVCEHLEVSIGDEVELIPATRSALSSFRSKRVFTVVGMFHSGWQEHDLGYAYISLEAAQNLLRLGDAVTGLGVEVNNPAKSYQIRDAIDRKLQGLLTVSTWEQQRQTFLQAITQERRVFAVILAVIAILAGFCIFVVTIMTVMQKTKDIGIIKACGGTTLGIMSIFVLNGFYVGLVGSAVGLGASLLLLDYVNPVAEFVERITGFHVFSQQLYYIDKIPVEYYWPGILWISVLAVVLSVAYTVYPAWRAARLNPVEALRYE